jgi:probable rRNA maturation factor
MMTGNNAPAIDIAIEAGPWQAQQDEAVVTRAIEMAAGLSNRQTGGAELSVVLTDDASIRAINAQWRHKDEPTNVLSFPAPPAMPGAPRLLGDIVIAHETTAREAKAEGKPFSDHLGHLAVHGFLHLLGYDHESDTDAEVMERLEREILAKLGVPDPYAARDS